MAMAIAFDEAKTNQRRIEGDARKGTIGVSVRTNFFGARDTPDLPHANLIQWDAGRFSRAHFHVSDQFQIVVGGKGRLGRHDLAPYGVHFSRAYTPYGPLSSDASTGLAYFVMRVHYDPGSQSLPKELDQLKQAPGRQPWQVTSQANFPAFQSGTAAAETMLQAIPGIKDQRGLAGYTLSMKPNAKTDAPDPAQGEGQYLAVVKGSVLHDGKELKAPALVFVYPREGPYRVHAGSAGLQALVLNFPRSQTRSQGAAKSVQAATGFKTWQCALCSFVYDEAAGMPGEGIPPGTRWQDVPETWSCPDCSASKGDFQMIDQVTQP